jgi:membrane associated rhomboid family serine protease
VTIGEERPAEAPPEEGAPPPGTPLVLPPPSALRVTWGLVAVNVAIFVLEALWGGSEWSPTLYRMGAITGRDALASEPWRVVSSAFLHIGPVHLLLNMWALYVFGHFLESLLGPSRLLVLYAAAAAGGGLASSLARDERLAAGASGAVWGLMVAELVLILRPRVLFEDLVFHVNKAQVLQPLALNLLISLQPGIDFVAHLGGGITGGLVMLSGVLARDPEGRAWRPAARVAGAVMAVCIAMAFARGRPWELRAPVLEQESLPGAPIALPVPRGLTMRVEGSVVTFGDLPRDPLVIQCRLAPPELRPAGGAQPERRRYPNGLVSDVWWLTDGVHALELEVARWPELPEPWPAVPARIAEGVVFRAGSPAPTAPGPSSPTLPPSPAGEDPPPSR